MITKNSKQKLIFTLQDLNFLRCIKPNDAKRANHFDEVYVEKQLQYAGTIYLVENAANVKRRMLLNILIASCFYIKNC